MGFVYSTSRNLNIWDVFWTDGAEYSRKVVSGRRVADAIRSLVNVRDFQFEYARVLHETLLVPFFYICQ